MSGMSVIIAGLLMGVSATPSPGCEAPIFSHPHPGHHARFEVGVTDPLMGEVTRSYLLHLPANYDTSNTSPVPLMLVRLTMIMTLMTRCSGLPRLDRRRQ